jgi:predicted membrane protein DUF2306
MGEAATAPSIKRTRFGLARQFVITIGFGYLAYQGLYFYVQDVGHFVRNYGEQGWGRLWPNRVWLMAHIVGATVAIFFGPFQLWSGLRQRHLAVHRWTGRLYVGGVLVAGTAAFHLSFYVEPRDLGFALFVLAAVWWVTVGTAFLAIKHHRIEAHKEWMIRGYVVTFSFVTFRWGIDLPLWSSLGSARSARLAIVLWLSWVVPIFFTEIFRRWRNNFGHNVTTRQSRRRPGENP